jgi:hypothetical protein
MLLFAAHPEEIIVVETSQERSLGNYHFITVFRRERVYNESRYWKKVSCVG